MGEEVKEIGCTVYQQDYLNCIQMDRVLTLCTRFDRVQATRTQSQILRPKQNRILNIVILEFKGDQYASIGTL